MFNRPDMIIDGGDNLLTLHAPQQVHMLNHLMQPGIDSRLKGFIG
jgi:hypothetical protein